MIAWALIVVLFWVVLIAIFVLTVIFWIFMLVDAIKREYKNPDDKILWILVIVLAGLIGAAIYYFVVKAEDNKLVVKK